MAGTSNPRSLQQWLDWQQQLNSAAIELGLDRVRRVGERLGVLRPDVPVINVAGTNGKGSVVAYLEAMLKAAGYRPGAYTSPHVVRYNERVRVGGVSVGDADLIAAFEIVEDARDGVPLTYFEFGTLAALVAFREAETDVLVLEVGLGGRLDAVNAVEPDVTVITAIGLDHADWLGGTLDAVAGEKAGIMRAGVPGIVGSRCGVQRLEASAGQLGAPVQLIDRDFRARVQGETWAWHGAGETLDALPLPAIPGPCQLDNAATAIAALRAGTRLDVPAWAIASGLEDVTLAGRCQHIPGPVEWVLDVAHNGEAAASLAGHLRSLPPADGRCWALFGAMARKDLHTLIAPLPGLFDGWFVMGLPLADAWSGEAIAETVGADDPGGRVCFHGPADETVQALERTMEPGDRVVAFGSFHVVEYVLTHCLPASMTASGSFS